eukprot:gene11539-13471_t
MLKIGVCSSIRISNSQSTSYHSASASTVHRVGDGNDAQSMVVGGSMMLSATDGSLPMTASGMSSIGSNSSSNGGSNLIESSSISVGSSSGITLQFTPATPAPPITQSSADSTPAHSAPVPLFSSVAFHPTAPLAYVAVGNEIYCNIHMKMLLGFTDEGLMYLWDTDTHKLLTIVHPLKQFDTRPMTCRVISPSRAIIFFAKKNSKDIVASVSMDGALKIWETRSQIAHLNLEDFTSYENSRNIDHSTNFFLAFEATQGKYMVMTGSSGLTLVYGDISSTAPTEIIANGFICRGNTILAVTHHPQLPVFFVLSVASSGIEELSAWEVNYQMKAVIPSLQVPTFVPGASDTMAFLAKYAKPLTPPRLVPTGFSFHPTRNYLTFDWELQSGSLASLRHINQFIYSLNMPGGTGSAPLVSTVPLPLGFFLNPDATFNYPPEITFFDGTFVKAYVPLNGVTRKVLNNPVIANTPDELTRPKSFNFNTEHQLTTLIYDSYSIPTQTPLCKYMIVDVTGAISQQGDGIDAVMLATQILIVGLDGRLAKVAQVTNQGISSFKSHALAPKIAAVFKTPLNDARVVQYYSAERNAIYFSRNISGVPADRDNYAVDQNTSLELHRDETVHRVEWQTDPRAGVSVCAIMTDMRIIITSATMSIITQIQVPPSQRATQRHFGSIFWLEWTLFYTTPTHLMYMTLQNNLAPRPLSSLSMAPIALSTVLPDRIVYGFQGAAVPGRRETAMLCQAVGLLEPLILGLLTLPPSFTSLPGYDKKSISHYLQNLVSKFDYTRISKFVLDKLREKGFVDLSYSLANKMRPCQSKMSSQDKFRMAWASKQYEDAHRHMNDEFARHAATKTPTDADRQLLNKLKDQSREFARECINAGYLQIARDCFIRLGESIYLLQISILLGDRDAVNVLRKEAVSKNDLFLVAACDRYLTKKAEEPPKVNPPVVKVLPWAPTPSISAGVKLGNDYLSQINLNSIQRYFPIVGPFSNTASSHGTTRHKLRAPDEQWPPEDYKHSVALSPPRTLMSLVANKLSTKTHMSSTQTLRRSPSAENISAKVKDYVGKSGASADIDFEDFDSDTDSDSGANATDIDSDTEAELNLVRQSIEEHIKSVQIEDDQDLIDDSTPQSTPPPSSSLLDSPSSPSPSVSM